MNKIIVITKIVLVCLILLAGALWVASASSCGTQDQCTEKKLEKARDVIKSYDNRITGMEDELGKERQMRESAIDIANGIKKEFTAGYLLDKNNTNPQEAKRQAPREFNSQSAFLSLPQAYASEGAGQKDNVFNQSYPTPSASNSSRNGTDSRQSLTSTGATVDEQKGPIRWAEKIGVGRYGKVLAEVGSPYANVPIEKYCNNANLDEKHCDMLVGIAQAESQNGTDYTCNWKTKEEANALGKMKYFNPVGLSDTKLNYRRGVDHKVPDSNGCYLASFPSWEDFWQWFPGWMQGDLYKISTRSNVSEISGRWVYGDDDRVNADWSYRANSFINKL